MQEKTRKLLKKLIEFHEACGRDRLKTIKHFVKGKYRSKSTIRKLVYKYEKLGMAVLDGKRKSRALKFQSTTLEMAKKVLELVKDDPSISNNEGAQIIGISATHFGRIKNDLLIPGRLTTEKKIQLGLIPAPTIPTQEVEAEGNISASDVNIELEKLNAEDTGVNFSDDDALNDFPFEDELVPTFPEPSRQGKGRKSFRHCLLCFIRLESENKASKKMTRNRTQRGKPSIPIPLSSMPNDEDGDGKLGENLNVIFTLKNIFGLESTDLVKFMEVSKGKDPRGWYHLCSECDEIMNEAVAIQRQVLQLTRELENCKSRIQEKVKESCGKGSGTLKTGDVNDDLLVTKLIRESICPPKKRKKKFRKTRLAAVEVKPEPVDEDDFEPTIDFGQDNFGDHENETFVNDSIEEAIVTNTPTEAIVAEIPHADPSTETELSSIIGISQSGVSIKDLKIKPKLVICDLCGEEMRKFSLPLHTLRVHDVLMDGYTEYKCPESGCHYKTVTKMHLKTHINHVHLPLKQGRKHSCHFCGKKFKCNNHLLTHLKIHTNAESRPYQCETCGRSFAVYTSLWSHVKGVHQGWVSPFRKSLKARNKKKTETVTDSETVSTSSLEKNAPLEQKILTPGQHGQQQTPNNLESECSANFLSLLRETKTIPI